jgi:Na+/H+ antiporter NhaD/arsenite permease-like protein
MDALGAAILAVFIGTYIIISTEKVNRTGMALLGMGFAGVVLWGGGHPFHELVSGIEWDTILFVTSMMMIVAVAGGSGMFQFLALRISKPSGGDHKRLFITFIVFVFVMSFFLDTTSTMVIMAPLTIQVCRALDIDFKPYLISEAIVCNFASIPSIVGAVPNLVIAGVTGLDPGLLFIAFMPLAIILLVVTLPIMLHRYRGSFGVTDEHRVEALARIDPATMITSKRDFYASIIAFAVLFLGFAIGPSLPLKITPPMVALPVAGFMLVLSHKRANKFLTEVGWDTVFFLVGIFGLVVALDMTGLVGDLGDWIQAVVGNDAAFATVFMIWIPALLSSFLDNLPVSVLLAPIASSPELLAVSPVLPLALIFAVNVGGYLTPLGAPANIVTMSFAEKEGDYISFLEFAKMGTILALIHLVIGSGWLLLVNFLMGG